ncbi:MAG: hypothetical protein ACE5GM_06805 [bacterium]
MAISSKNYFGNLPVISLLLGIIIINASYHKPFRQPVEHDFATLYYYTQEVGKGRLFYRDVWDVKAPLTFYLLSSVYRLHHRYPFIDYIVSVRLLLIGILFLSALIIFFLLDNWLNERWSALTAALIFASLTDQMLYACMGPTSKIMMNFTGLVSLWFVSRNRYGAAGLFAGLAFLNWQPGIAFVIPFIFYLYQKRKTKIFQAAVRYISFFFLPLVVMILYYWFNGALHYLYHTLYTFGTYRVSAHFHPQKTIKTIHEVVAGLGEKHLFYLSLAVFSGYPAFRLLQRFLSKPIDKAVIGKIDLLFALSMATVTYSVVNFNWILDTVPFTPLVSVWSGLFFSLPVWLLPLTENAKKAYLAVTMLLILAYSLSNCVTYNLNRTVFEGGIEHGKHFRIKKRVVFDRDYQERYIRRITGSSPRIFSLGSAEYLLLWELSNPIPFVVFPTELEVFVNNNFPGGWPSLYSKIKAADPDYFVIHPSGDPETLKRLYDYLKENNYKIQSWQHKKRSVYTFQEFLYDKRNQPGSQ